jgi:hypothetical protein
MAEDLPFKQDVGGSSPSRSTNPASSSGQDATLSKLRQEFNSPCRDQEFVPVAQSGQSAALRTPVSRWFKSIQGRQVCGVDGKGAEPPACHAGHRTGASPADPAIAGKLIW